jgi:thiosulfate/3-mercaptopyruvate sulfurtransferase
MHRRHALGTFAGLAGLLAAACGQNAGPSTAGVTTGAPGAFANANLLVSADWLKQHIKDTGVRVVDARSAADYEKGHLPGAVNLPVAETFDPTRDRNYPDTKEKLEALLGGKGIGNNVRVVTYDNGSGSDTTGARLFWTLEYLGHTNMSYLDGGVKAWQSVGGELSTAPIANASFTSKIDPAKLPTKEQCQLAIGDKTKVVLDARSPEEYRGEDVRAKFGGHIPGAVNIDYRLNFSSQRRTSRRCTRARESPKTRKSSPCARRGSARRCPISSCA